MKLIVGLGNPGRRYEATRHNIGFDVIAELARRYANGNPKTRFQGETIDATWDGRSYLLLLPQTFMNLSGSSVVAARDFYQLEAADILVVCDDFNLPLGQLRLRARGSAGGQKGLADIISRLGTDQIPRLRLGIGPVPPAWDAVDFVLGKFTRSERPVVDDVVQLAANAAAEWGNLGIQVAMNRYNAKTSS